MPFTAFVVAVVARWPVPDLPWAAIALGAILAIRREPGEVD